MHDGMQYYLMQNQGQGHEPLKSEIRPFSKAISSPFLANATTLRSLYAIADPSVCLSVTLVHPTQPVETFGNFFLPYDSPGTLVF